MSNNKKPFNFGDAPLVRDTEQTVTNGYEAIELKEQGGGVPETKTPESASQPTEEPAQQAEETKGIQAYISMSLYTRMYMLKLKTKEPLGSMFQQAIALWLDVQEGKASFIRQ